MELHETNLKMTDEQQVVMNRIKDFFDSDTPVFILKGYAGTGKTTMVKEIAHYVKDKFRCNAVLMAPTGRAARVLSKKTGEEARTIHRTIYQVIYDKGDSLQDKSKESQEDKIFFCVRTNAKRVIAIVDEASMVSSRKSEQEYYQFGTDVMIDDLLTFVNPNEGGKVIFVGDPAQLPPVGDKESCALDENYFVGRGLKCMCAELTQVLRQGGNSMILKNAMEIRDVMNSDKRNRLVFEEKGGEVETIQQHELVDKYMAEDSDALNGDCVIIAYTNSRVSGYNKQIREKRFGRKEPLREGEPLLVVRNNTALNLMNGEFVRVLSLGEVESQSANVYVEKNGVKEQAKVTILFQDARIQRGEDDTIRCKLVLNLLDIDEPSLSIERQKALYINFCMRHPELKKRTHEFTDALWNDPYFNALQVKYGYAVTGHKCQGGEWKKVFVDFDQRAGLNDDCLRWDYTTVTRARQTLYVANPPHITPFDNFCIMLSIKPLKKIRAEFRKFGKIEETPFHTTDSPVFLRAKYECVRQNMNETQFEIDSVDSKPYLEIYKIKTPAGTERYDIIYNKDGLFKPAKAQNPSEYSSEIESLLNDERNMPIEIDYEPSDDVRRQLYEHVRSACDALSILITNVVEYESEYCIRYFLYTSVVSYLCVYFNKDGELTYADASSVTGNKDEKLSELINELNK